MKNLFKSLIPIVLIFSMMFTMGIETIEENENPVENEITTEKSFEILMKVEPQKVEETKKEEETKKVEPPKAEETKKEELKKETPKKEEAKKETESPKPPVEIQDKKKDKEELKEEIEKEEVEEAKGSIKINNTAQDSDGNEFDIFIEGPNGSLYTVSLASGESITIKNLETGNYTISTIIPMNYELVNIVNENISIREDDLDKEGFISYIRRNRSWFYSN